MTAPRPWYRWIGDCLELRVRVQTRCRDEGITHAGEEVPRVRVNAPPVEGRANERLLVVLAAAFGVPRSRVRLVHGARSRHKRISIERPQRLPGSLGSAPGAPSRVEKSGKAV